MCGFTGIIKPRNDKFQSIKALELSKDIISHRGNDKSQTFINEDKGIYLAFNRLSIVDTEERSSQPMRYTHQNKSIIGMLNGEIYNYLEIKSNLIKKGYHFSTTSDTEVLLALIIDKGIEAVNSLQGIFSIFIYFQDLEKIFLIRDQIGVKPLYFAYGVNDWNFLFASEIKALLPMIKGSVEINKGAFTGACMVHDNVKVVAQLKGKLGTTALFSSIKADKNALPPAIEPPKNPLPILTPGTYVVVVEAHQIIHSFPGIKVPFLGRVAKPKPSFNYYIQHSEKSHCAWAVDSMEANFLSDLLKKSPNSD